jgi:hypothetical protein
LSRHLSRGVPVEGGEGGHVGVHGIVPVFVVGCVGVGFP